MAIVWNIVAFIAGTMFGMVIMSCCAAAGQADDKAEELTKDE